ncbi:MAG: SH3 domain-containing protein [Deltaproteobacteria bacterium]|nr:SH3 domain-containing protein [Deltaproteobacteria bacterium]
MQSVGTETKYLNLDIPKKILLGLLFLMLFLIPALSYAAAPINSPSFWIKKLKNPDTAVLSQDEIETLNAMILDDVEHMADLESMPETVSGDRVFEWLWTGFLLKPGARYDSSGKKISEEFIDDVAYNMGLDSIAEEYEIRFGVVIERGDIRALPTDAPMYTSRRGGFDMMQYTSAHPTEPVALLHESRDGEWGFFQTSTLRGWMRLDKVAFGERDEVMASTGDFLVVTGSHVKVYRDFAMKEPLSEVKMGALLRVDGSGREQGEPWKVNFPDKGPSGELVWVEAYLSPVADVNLGYLPYTRKNIIRQAFKMLGEEYGWGGREGLRDCSLFIKDLFATVGLNLPRNSRLQGSTGDVKAKASEARSYREISKALKSADPGITLLTLNGHVMLHIGDLKGKPYVIHQIFGYKDGRRMKLIKKTAVTGLDLGKRSRAGSFQKRLKSVTRVTIPGEKRAQALSDKSA